ncbi:MAG: NAD(P)/FAD-dependent oxidoreductase [Bacteroidia bacterium]|nr:NAD(P)/FAD-dependent oxidoreductase [Bacteroidia bacterium]
MYDIIVIGGGHNGLTSATYLAKKGKKVAVVEKREVLGGIAAGEEFHTGFRTNGLYHHASTVRANVIKELELEKHGLSIQTEAPSYAALSKNNEGIIISGNDKETHNNISQFSPKDADAYLAYRSFINKISTVLYDVFNEAPPDVEQLGLEQLWILARKGISLKRLGNKTMMELLKVAPMNVADFLNEKFEIDFLKAAICAPSIYCSNTGPWSSYTTLNLLLWECFSKINVVGGPQALTNSLESAAKSNGVEIITGRSVKCINLDENKNVYGVTLDNDEELKASKVVSSVTPQVTFYDLIKSNQIEYTLDRDISYIRSRGTTAKVNLGMKGKASFSFDPDERITYARTGNSFDEMEKAFDSVKYREFSSDPILDIHIPTIDNSELAPEGHDVLSILVHFAPHNFDAGWDDEQKKELRDNVINSLQNYIPNISENIVGEEVLSPVDIEERYGLTNGHIFHGEHAIDQLLTRPFPSCSQYSTPIKGLFLCGSGSHPGGGITCAPGALAAKAILKS